MQAVVRRAECEAQAVVDAVVVGIGGSILDGTTSRAIRVRASARGHVEDMAYAVERAERCVSKKTA